MFQKLLKLTQITLLCMSIGRCFADYFPSKDGETPLIESAAHDCDFFDGFWRDDNTWNSIDCGFQRIFSNHHVDKSMEAKARKVRMLFLGDSNDDSTLLDNIALIGGTCERLPLDALHLVKCSSPTIEALKVHAYSAFPYTNNVLNYCVEFHDRPADKRTYFLNHSELMDHGVQKFEELFGEKPNIISFAINFWEMVRIREAMSCEKGKLQEINKKRWLSNTLDDAYIRDWTTNMQSGFQLLRERGQALNAFVFTRTFQIPRLNSDGHATHTNLHSANFIQQLNSANRVAAGRSGIPILDIERMTSYFWNHDAYLRDMLHYKPFVAEEVWNILFHWYDVFRATQEEQERQGKQEQTHRKRLLKHHLRTVL